MGVKIAEVERIASLSMLSLDDAQKRAMQQNLSDILGHVQKLSELDTEGVPPTTYISDQKNIFRPDVPGRPSVREDMLKNAPEQQDDCFIVPKVVE